MRDQAEHDGQDTGDLDELTAELDGEITEAGMRGNVLPSRPVRRHRTTRRRQDAAPLPRRKIAPRTVGKTYTTPDGKQFRPSLFVTLTCPSYGRVRDDGTAADPDSYGYQRAARDALHFAALFDRFVQNLRRFLGYDLQYFAAIEPQRRLAPHVHIAMRGTISRADLRQVLAATYHHVWWPDTGRCSPSCRTVEGRRPPALASRPQRSQTTSSPARAPGSFGDWEGGMSGADAMTQGRLLTVEAAAERLSTKPRFIRRLIAERRIEFVKVGRHVRITESALAGVHRL